MLLSLYIYNIRITLAHRFELHGSTLLSSASIQTDMRKVAPLDVESQAGAWLRGLRRWQVPNNAFIGKGPTPRIMGNMGVSVEVGWNFVDFHLMPLKDWRM